MVRFKFHYVSINSYYEAYESNYDITLNSIMFLLIRIVAVWCGIVTISTLNSIMFLLIQILMVKL